MSFPFSISGNLGKRSTLPVAPVFTAPVNQEIITEDVAYTVTVTSVGDTSVTLKDGGSTIGAMTNAGGGVWTYTWTPTSPDYDVQLNAVGNNSGQGQTLTIVVAEANLVSQDISAWTPTNVTVTGSQPDPAGGSTAYKLTMANGTGASYSITRNASSAPANINSGQEVWFGYESGCNIKGIHFYSSSDGGAHSNTSIKIDDEQARLEDSSIAIVERKVVGSITWVRIWMQFQEAVSQGPQNFTFYFDTDISGTLQSTFTTSDFLYMWKPRTADGNLPFTAAQRYGVYYRSVASGVETWTVNSPYSNTAADLDASPIEFWVIKPTGWSSTGQYPVLYALPALSIGTENLRTIFASYPDEYGCVVVIPYFRSEGAFYWAGSTASGTHNDHLSTVAIRDMAIKAMGASSNKDEHLLIGYSKTGFAALNLLMLNPTKFGYAYAWDGKYDNNYATEAATYGWNNYFGSSGQFQLYDPKVIAPTYKANVSDTTRIYLSGYYTFGADQLSIKAVFDAESIPYNYQRTLESAHSWTSGWLAQAVEDLFLMADLIDPPVNTVLPVISGDPYTDEVLNVGNGTWTSIGTPSYTYQWKKDGVSIGGATTSAYTVVAGDVGSEITGTVTATNAGGATFATTAGLTILAGSNPDAGPTDGILLEDGTSFRLLEDGTSFRVQETQ
jgi:hypothetical protein